MKNTLKLHEAIAVILLSKEGRKAPFREIAAEINKRKLYIRKDENPVPDYQIKQRTILSGGQYHHLFSFQKPDIIKLK
jgi:hypothetical protein